MIDWGDSQNFVSAVSKSRAWSYSPEGFGCHAVLRDPELEFSYCSISDEFDSKVWAWSAFPVKRSSLDDGIHRGLQISMSAQPLAVNFAESFQWFEVGCRDWSDRRTDCPWCPGRRLSGHELSFGWLKKWQASVLVRIFEVIRVW